MSHDAWVPRELAANLRFRAALLDDCLKSPSNQRAVRDACARDVLFWVNTSVWQYNPNEEPGSEVGPFVTWDFQDEAFPEILRAIHDRRDLVIEKSRDMGASWMCLLAYLWLWQFHRNKTFICISRDEKAVDSANPSSLFWKLDFVLKHQPDWLVPEFERTKLFFGNSETDSTIYGEASTGKAGVGGRATSMFIDEFSQIREDKEVLSRTADTTRSRIFNGTHVGTGTEFYKLCRERPDVRKIVLHWTMHPAKNHGLYHHDADSGEPLGLVRHDTSFEYEPDHNFVLDGTPGGPFAGVRSPWYDAECVRRADRRQIAMDLDLDPTGSTFQFFDPLTINQLKARYGCDPLWEGEIDLNHDQAVSTGLTRQPGGRLKLWLQPTHDGGVPAGTYTVGGDVAAGTGATPSCLSVLNAETGEKVAQWSCRNTPPEAFAHLAVALCRLFASPAGEGAYFCWEIPGPGILLGKVVTEDLKYLRVYWDTRDLAYKAAQRPGDVPGWYNTGGPKKRTLFEEYRSALYGRRLVNHSVASLDEALNFVHAGRGTVEHSRQMSSKDPTEQGDNHGDQVMADCLALRMATQLGRLNAKVEEADPHRVPANSVAGRRAARKSAQESDW